MKIKDAVVNKIIEKTQLSQNVYKIQIQAPLIAEERKPGQFVIVQINSDYAERIPLTIADADTTAGSITLIFQVVGKTTYHLSLLNKGDIIQNVLGPLGNPTHIEKWGTVVCVGGGIGAAPLYPVVKALKAASNKVIIILGARSKELLILEQEMKALADELILCTDDGSYGRKALVTEPLQELCHKDPKPDRVFAIGPAVMMKFCAETTRPFGIPTVVSLNTIMVDGTGMCGGCRVSVGGETKFVCVDGPEFDGHQVDFDNMMRRLNSYHEFEHKAFQNCRLPNEIKKKTQEKI
jgi:ferredoxin--NADP+ reductase